MGRVNNVSMSLPSSLLRTTGSKRIIQEAIVPSLFLRVLIQLASLGVSLPAVCFSMHCMAMLTNSRQVLVTMYVLKPSHGRTNNLFCVFERLLSQPSSDPTRVLSVLSVHMMM